VRGGGEDAESEPVELEIFRAAGEVTRAWPERSELTEEATWHGRRIAGGGAAEAS